MFGPELNVYDFDDTLVQSKGTGSIYIVNKKLNTRVRRDAQDFHDIILKDSEELDLREVESHTGKKLLKHFYKLKQDYKKLGSNGVAICTARSDASAIAVFLNNKKIFGVETVAVGDRFPSGEFATISAVRKKEFLREKIIKRELKILRFYDDNELNCIYAQELKKEFPDVEIHIEHVN